MSDEFVIQTEAQETNIRNKQATKELINEVTSNIENNLVGTTEISDKLDTLIVATAQTNAVASDLSLDNTVQETINPNIDLIGDQNKDMLDKLNQQDIRINALEDKLDLILEKLE